MQALPKTIYLWLAVLVLSFAVRAQRQPLPARGSVGYETYVAAEQNTRLAFAQPSKERLASLEEALKGYQQVARITDQPNPTRKVLIVGNLLGKPLDAAALKRLPEKERPLWQALYGKPPTPPLPPDAEAQVRAMQLRFLDTQVLGEVLHKQGKRAQALTLENRRDAGAQRSNLRWEWLTDIHSCFAVVGLWLLFFVLQQARARRWQRLGRLPEPTDNKLNWGTLLDVFVFYLALYRGLGVLSNAVLQQLHLSPDRVLFSVGLRTLSSTAAIGYLWWRLRRCRATWAELGLTRERLGADLLYGLAGYAALQPVFIVLHLLNTRFLVPHLESASNSVLPMIANRTGVFDQVLLFVSTSLLAPFFEELFFRGVLFTGLRRRYAGVSSVLLSAVLFAMVHPQRDWLPIFGLGVGLAVLRHLRQSVVPEMVVHALQNGWTFLMLHSVFGQ